MALYVCLGGQKLGLWGGKEGVPGDEKTPDFLVEGFCSFFLSEDYSSVKNILCRIVTASALVMLLPG